jgi:hypothetical protein
MVDDRSGQPETTDTRGWDVDSEDRLLLAARL